MSSSFCDRKNEKSTGRNSIEESIGRNEKTSRQRKTRSRGMKEGRKSNSKYKRLSIQIEISEKVDGEICGAI